MNPFFSIIIPTYNTEKYIARCLDSCIGQTFKNIEILVVDDFGSDNSIAIVQSYTKSDKRIKIIHNSHNLGLFHTRLEGEKRACGKYIIHVDSDDFIDIYLCELLYKKITIDHKRTNQYADICSFGIAFFPNTFQKKPINNITRNLFNENIIKYFILKPSTPPWSICGKAFYSDTVKETIDLIEQLKLNIPSLTMAEDALKFLFIAIIARRSIGIDKKMYFYFFSQTSITRKKDKQTSIKKNRDLLNIVLELERIKYNDRFSEIHRFAITKTQNILKSTIELERRYANKPFAYPLACIKSLKYHQKWQTYLRIALFLVSFGRIKI